MILDRFDFEKFLVGNIQTLIAVDNGLHLFKAGESAEGCLIKV